MKKRVGDEKLIIISVAVRGVNDHIRFWMLNVGESVWLIGWSAARAFSRERHLYTSTTHSVELRLAAGSQAHGRLGRFLIKYEGIPRIIVFLLSFPSFLVFCFVAHPIGRGWLGSRVVSVLDSGAEGPGFKSQSRRCRVTVSGKLFTTIVPLLTKQRNW